MSCGRLLFNGRLPTMAEIEASNRAYFDNLAKRGHEQLQASDIQLDLAVLTDECARKRVESMLSASDKQTINSICTEFIRLRHEAEQAQQNQFRELIRQELERALLPALTHLQALQADTQAHPRNFVAEHAQLSEVQTLIEDQSRAIQDLQETLTTVQTPSQPSETHDTVEIITASNPEQPTQATEVSDIQQQIVEADHVTDSLELISEEVAEVPETTLELQQQAVLTDTDPIDDVHEALPVNDSVLTQEGPATTVSVQLSSDPASEVTEEAVQVSTPLEMIQEDQTTSIELSNEPVNQVAEEAEGARTLREQAETLTRDFSASQLEIERLNTETQRLQTEMLRLQADSRAQQAESQRLSLQAQELPNTPATQAIPEETKQEPVEAPVARKWTHLQETQQKAVEFIAPTVAVNPPVDVKVNALNEPESNVIIKEADDNAFIYFFQKFHEILSRVLNFMFYCFPVVVYERKIVPIELNRS